MGIKTALPLCVQLSDQIKYHVVSLNASLKYDAGIQR